MKRKCEDCGYCQFPRTSDDNAGACKCKLMKRRTIDVIVTNGGAPTWCPLRENCIEKPEFVLAFPFSAADCVRTMYDPCPEGKKDNAGCVAILKLTYLQYLRLSFQ